MAGFSTRVLRGTVIFHALVVDKSHVSVDNAAAREPNEMGGPKSAPFIQFAATRPMHLSTVALSFLMHGD
jgi:hypothetical protein